MQKLILKLAGILGKVAAAFLIAFVSFLAGMVYQEQNPTQDVFDLLPSFTHQVKILQKRAGCLKIDAEVGPEFKRMVNAAVKREKCQQSYDWAVANMPEEKK